jgi:hypothetical protein
MIKLHGRSRLYLFIICGVLTLAAVALFMLVALPYPIFKHTLGSLMSDGNFKSLHTSNAIVFRGFFLATGIALCSFSYLLISGKFQPRIWYVNLSSDSNRLIQAFAPANDEKWFLVTLILLIILGTLARLSSLRLPLSHDEAYTTVVFAPSIWSAITDYHAPNNHVFHTLLVHFSTSLFGLSGWSIRLPALIAGILLIPATYWLGKSIYDKYAGLLAAIFVSFLPAQILYSANARGYSIIALITLILFWLGDFVRKDKNVLAWLLIIFFSALGLWTIPIMLFPFGILFAWLFMENLLVNEIVYGSRGNFLKYWLIAGFSSAGLTFFLYTPIFIFSGLWKMIGVNVPVPWDQMGNTLLAYVGGIYGEWFNGVPFFIVVLLIIGFMLALFFHRRLSKQHFPLQIAAIIWIIILVIIERPEAWTRIWFFLMTPALIWSSAGLIGLVNKIHVKILGNISGSVILIVSFMFLPVAAAWQSLASMPEAVQQVSSEETISLFIKDQLQEKDLIVAMWPADASLWYYSKVHGIPDSHFDRNLPFERAFIIVSPKHGQTLNFVIAQTHMDSDSLDMDSAKVIQDFSGNEIYLIKHR